MNQYMDVLLKQINYPSEKYDLFKNANVDKIIGNRDKTKYIFYITIENMLTPADYQEFMYLVNKAYENFSSVDVLFSVINKKSSDIRDFYKLFIKKISNNSPLITALGYLRVEVKIDTLRIETLSYAQKIRIESITDKLKMFYKKIGYDELNITTLLLENHEIQEEINNDLKIKVSKEALEQSSIPKIQHEEKRKWNGEVRKRGPLIVEPDNPLIVFGKLINDSSIRLDTVALPGTVIVEAEIFGKDVITTKTNLRIITLKLTDYTDSIYAKIFVNDEEEFNIIDKKLKVGNWYKIKGSVKNDDYSHELTLSATDINVFDYVKEELVDDAEIKRVELHAHTMMSQMDGVTKLDLGKHTCELVEKTIKMGYRGVAITDHSGCQAFPISFGIIKSHNKKVRANIKSKIEELENAILEESDESKKNELTI